MMEDQDWSHVAHTNDVNCATDLLNETIHSIMDKCFPKRTILLSSRDPPWMSSLVKYLLKKKNQATNQGKTTKAAELSSKISKLIATNRKTLGTDASMGSAQWWRKVDNLSLRKHNHLLFVIRTF